MIMKHRSLYIILFIIVFHFISCSGISQSSLPIDIESPSYNYDSIGQSNNAESVDDTTNDITNDTTNDIINDITNDPLDNTFENTDAIPTKTYGTEIGNPKQSRIVTGNFTRPGDPEKSSCDFDLGLTVNLTNTKGNVVKSALLNGSFLAEIDPDESYKMQLEQNDKICGQLTYGRDQDMPTGYYALIDHGSWDIDLGTIEFSYGDSFNIENDDQLKNTSINSDFDLNLNGYADWFEDLETDFATENTCLVKQIYPFDQSQLAVNQIGQASVDIYTTQIAQTIDLSQLSITTGNSFSTKPAKIDSYTIAGSVITLYLSKMEESATYNIQIGSGGIQCVNGASNERNIDLNFDTILLYEVVAQFPVDPSTFSLNP